MKLTYQDCPVCHTNHGASATYQGDNPCCVRCRRYNAMLLQFDRVTRNDVMKCRDCGYTETIDR
jgi:hypothetical protein